MAQNDIYRVDVHSTLQKNPNVNCFFYQETDEVTPGGNPTKILLDEFVATNLPDMLELFDETMIVDCTTCQLHHPTKGFPQLTEGPLPGLKMMAVALPGQCSMVAQTLSNLDDITARNRGRDFHTGFVETEQVDGTWTVAAVALVGAFYVSEMMVPLMAGGGTFVYGNFSATQAAENINPLFLGDPPAQTPPPTFGDPPFQIVSQVQITTKVRTQRRRQPLDPCILPTRFPPA